MATIVPLMLVGIAVLLMAGTHVLTKKREKRQAAAAAAAPLPHVLIHSINDDRCTGCDACVAVCPTDVLELVNHKSRVQRFGDCIQCEQCMMACPTQALVMHMDDEDPPPVKVPHLDPYYQTGVPGMYLIGEVAGKPLVKNAANIGRAVIEHMLREGIREQGAPAKRAEGSDSRAVALVDVAIVGSGPGGLSAALTCMHHGLTYAILEKEQVIASTVSRYPKGKDVMAEPYDVRNVSFLPVYDATKEQLVDAWQQMVAKGSLGIKMGEAVESVKREEDGTFTVRTTVAVYRAKRVVLGTGTRGKPRTLGVPGENLPKIASLLDDPDLYKGKDVLVVGGGDSAIEAACALAEAGARVVLSYRGKQFNRAAAKNRDKVMKYGKDRKVNVMLGSQLAGFTDDKMTITNAEGKKLEMPNHQAFVLIGADPPVAWLEKLGVQFVERPHWYALGSTDQLVESLIGKQSESPRDVSKLIALVRGEEAPIPAADELPPVPEASVMIKLPMRPTERPRTLPGFALGDGGDSLFPAPGKDGENTLIAGMSLAEFARQSREKRAASPAIGAPVPAAPVMVGGATRKKVRTSEETRILRGLRDEGARLAHDDTGINLGREAPPAAPVAAAPVKAVEQIPADDVNGLYVFANDTRGQRADSTFEDESTRLADEQMREVRRAAVNGPPPAQPRPAAPPLRAVPPMPPPQPQRLAAPPATAPRSSQPRMAPVPPAPPQPTRQTGSAQALRPAGAPATSRATGSPAPVPINAVRSPARKSPPPPFGGPPPPAPPIAVAPRATPPAPPRAAARPSAPPFGGPPPPQPRSFGDDDMATRVAAELPRDADDGWAYDEATAMADPDMVANLREQLRQK